jgi:hypothetical protein
VPVQLKGDSVAEDTSDPRLLPPQFKPERAADVWEGEDGRLWQRCTGCEVGKPYDEFYNDRVRWNGKASKCKMCKSSQASEYRDRKKTEDAAA